MSVSRRAFLHTTAAAAAAWPLTVRGWQAPAAAPTGSVSPRRGQRRSADRSRDPLDARNAAAEPQQHGPIEVRWQVASDERLSEHRGARHGAGGARSATSPSRSMPANLKPGATYFYAFDAGGEQSPIGRTKTLPDRGSSGVCASAQVSCSNYPTGYFNVYRCLANRADLDAVVHLGDYIYEFANGRYSDPSLGRVTLQPADRNWSRSQDYRSRYAFYRSDVDLQAVHRQHPFIVVWDDHELANDAWSGGAGNHNASQGDWRTRQRAAYRAYLEWMPVRETLEQPRSSCIGGFAFGGLADLLMLDTRGLRDQQAPANDAGGHRQPEAHAARRGAGGVAVRHAAGVAGGGHALANPRPADPVLAAHGARHERAPAGHVGRLPRGARAHLRHDRQRPHHRPCRTHRRHSQLVGAGHRRATLVAVRTRRQGTAREGVEIVTPAVSSPPMFSTPAQREIATMLQPLARHLKFLEGDSRGYVLLDVTPKALIAEWYFVPTVTERTDRETRAARFVCESGSSRLVTGPRKRRVRRHGSPRDANRSSANLHSSGARTHSSAAAMHLSPC